jgi:glutamate-1-semialdehyde aminotransferase
VRIAGGSSTGSKRAAALFDAELDPPLRTVRSAGCSVWDEGGREYLDFVMSLGAVALGYGHPAVARAAHEAVDRGTVGSLPPVEEEELATLLAETMPWLERVRFLKTGAEAVAAAVRLARVATGRDRVLTCGYHGWLDWCGDSPGVPQAVRALSEAIPFNDLERGRAAIRRDAEKLACVVVEPVVDGLPAVEWLTMLRDETARAGSVLIFDEIKTAFRVAPGGAVERWSVRPDLVVLGKALANGFPLAAVGGRPDIMGGVARTWISSTLATESVALAAARATVHAIRDEGLPAHVDRVGALLHAGLSELADRHPRLAVAAGIPAMCHLRFHDDAIGGRVARECLERGLLFKRNAYNFVSLAHDESHVTRCLEVLDEVLARC